MVFPISFPSGVTGKVKGERVKGGREQVKGDRRKEREEGNGVKIEGKKGVRCDSTARKKDLHSPHFSSLPS